MRCSLPGRRAVLAVGLLSLLAPALPAAPSRAIEAWDGRAQLHGYVDFQFRWISDGFDANKWIHSQWANVLNLELELDLAPNGFGPFDVMSAFARVEVRYECVFTGCGVAGTHRYFGDRATRAPARNWRDGFTSSFVGAEVVPGQRRPIHRDSDLLTLLSAPLLEPLADLGATNLEGTFAPVAEDLFTFKKTDGTREQTSTQLGPWSTRSEIEPIGALRSVANSTLPLPLRPSIDDDPRYPTGAQGLYVPSDPLVQRLGDFDDFDQNFRGHELAWNHGGGQDEHELKELYLDLEMFESRLWMRIGKQNIVWGKTELFRTTDLFNPQDIGLSSLPSLEESRLALWSVRAVWSFYEVGPLQDVRLEVAANLDDFEPTDLGRCGEPYTVWLVCGKSVGLFGHGVLGIGLAGEVRPPDPWDDLRGVEVGARLEWRWERFSFALTDFWGYSDSPVLEAFHFYERQVDPRTGRPLDTRGRPLTPARAREFHPGNRQFYDIVCSATVGISAGVLPALGNVCVPDVPNSAASLGLPGLFSTVTPAQALAAVLAGKGGGEIVASLLLTGAPGPVVPKRLVPLNIDPADGPGAGLFSDVLPIAASLSEHLTREQEALLGCGPFYRTNCDLDGIDLFNAEASVLIQSFPFNEEDSPVATRFVDGRVIILPGARGPGDRGYNPRVDGTPPPGFSSELAALSENFARLLAILAITGGDDPDCSLDQLALCELVRAVVAVTGTQRPDLRAGGNGRFGRRDFIWMGGGEALLFYPKVNTIGFSMDFAEDRTKSNWSFEFTWVDDAYFGSTTSRSLFQRGDVANLTVSVDRPTFVNFLNANRTFFFNAQVFFQYLNDYNESYTTNGPFNVLATFAIATGYYQDRLLPSLVFVHDVASSSGAILPQVTWRVTQDFAISVGAAFFYGHPEYADVALHQLALSNNGGDFRSRSQYAGLSPIAERDEVFLRIRYTF